MTYIIRDSNGVLKMKMSDETALTVVKTGQGHFRKCRYQSCVGGVCYEIDTPVKFEIRDTSFYFWEGDVLYKSNV